jgi:hypothetical protein
MRCKVVKSAEFESWWRGLREVEQDKVTAVVTRLRQKGVTLGDPWTSDVKGSKYGTMRELRVRTHPPIRVFYAFDPLRRAVVLVGGRKRGQEKRFYREHVDRADAIYDEYLRQLRRGQLRERDESRNLSRDR